MSVSMVSLDDKQRLLEALLAVPALHDSDTRDAYVAETESLLNRPLGAARFAEPRHDLFSVVSASLLCSGGLNAFAAVVSRHNTDQPAATLATGIADNLAVGLLSAPDRATLQRLITDIAAGPIADAVGELVEPGELTSLAAWRDLPGSIRRLEELPRPDDGVPQILTFVDRLAHIVGGSRAEELSRWTELVAGGLGVSTVDLLEMRAASQRSIAEGRLTPAAVVDEPATPAEREIPGLPEPREPFDGATQRRPGDLRLIWSGVPIRNRTFTGRESLLRSLGDTLQVSSKASVLPQALYGMGGVGKTQLVIEYVYRNVDRYDLVWWVSAEQSAMVLASFTSLAERLGLPTSEDVKFTAATVLDSLANSKLRWLLVFDNADDPESLADLIPAAGGHVILTSRNHAWAGVGQPIEVDVFERTESIELLRKRGRGISEQDADILADKLGDLPLALEQAAAWQSVTGMPVSEYVELLDNHVRELLSEGKPMAYPTTVAAFVNLAVDRLRTESPATAQLMELFAFLGAEPVAVNLLRFGQRTDISEPLRSALYAPIEMNRIIRDLRRYGLARVDPVGQRIQVHRLVQLVLRESLPAELARQSKANVQNLLAAANPGDPDEQPSWEGHAELGPHIRPADLIHADTAQALQVVLDQIRYLYLIGDYEGSRRLADEAVEAWRAESGPSLGPDGEFTLIASRHLANTLRSLGFSEAAEQMANETFEQMENNPNLGPRHESTLVARNLVGSHLRISGQYADALEFDRESLNLHRDVFGEGDHYTLRAQANLAVDLRMIGDFGGAYQIDSEVASQWEVLGENDARALFAQTNVARDLYGMGRYDDGIALQARIWPILRDLLGPGHTSVLLAARTYAITMRKAGRLRDALDLVRETLLMLRARFGANHEHSVATALSLANALRAVGETDEALTVASDSLKRYRDHYGQRHPLTLAAVTNLACVRRARSEHDQARALDTECHPAMVEVLGAAHPYTLCTATNLASDLALAGEHDAAVRLSSETVALSETGRGAEHPYTLLCMGNLVLDLEATGALERAESLRASTVATLRRVLGPDHRDTLDVEHGVRIEADIEPQPT